MKHLLSLFLCLSACAQITQFGIGNTQFVAPASTGALTLIVSSTAATTRSDGPFVWGVKFTANANTTVTQVGLNIVAGGTQTHHVGIYDVATGTLQTSGTISFSGKSGLNYVSVTPYGLTSGSSYVCCVENASGDAMYTDTPGVYTSSSDFTIIESEYASSAWPAYPSNTGTSGGHDYGWATFIYTKP
jgi:hypothetical protein